MSTTQTFTLIIWANLTFYKAFQVEILVIRTFILFSSSTCKYKANIMLYSLNIMLFGLTQNRITTTTKKYKTNIKIIQIIKSNKNTRIKRCHNILRQLHKFEKLQNMYVIFLYIFLILFFPLSPPDSTLTRVARLRTHNRNECHWQWKATSLIHCKLMS